jgi:hypothetical protein
VDRMGESKFGKKHWKCPKYIELWNRVQRSIKNGIVSFRKCNRLQVARMYSESNLSLLLSCSIEIRSQ